MATPMTDREQAFWIEYMKRMISDHPVPKHTENSVIDREFAAYRKKQEPHP